MTFDLFNLNGLLFLKNHIGGACVSYLARQASRMHHTACEANEQWSLRGVLRRPEELLAATGDLALMGVFVDRPMLASQGKQSMLSNTHFDAKLVDQVTSFQTPWHGHIDVHIHILLPKSSSESVLTRSPDIPVRSRVDPLRLPGEPEPVDSIGETPLPPRPRVPAWGAEGTQSRVEPRPTCAHSCEVDNAGLGASGA